MTPPRRVAAPAGPTTPHRDRPDGARRARSPSATRPTPLPRRRNPREESWPDEPARPVLIDCTLGMGGHSEGALTRFPHLTVVGIDRDREAIALASARLAPFGDRFRAVRTTYDHVDEVACDASPYGDGTVDAVLMDLGVSSLQLDDAGRGFSYSRPAPLDMRMDQSAGTTAQQLLETAEEHEITRILRAYGEERFAPRIAAALVRRREAGRPVRDTADLAELVRESVPAAARRTGGHPAKRTFQALRIAVNAELEVLERAVPRALNSIRVGGRLVVESYQSLEDRIVKQAIAAGTTTRAPEGLPFVPDDAAPY
ncbi:16S rRNA (cytosine(1402)-N(4))-methyltransferase RsmH, partial [Actinomyces sp. 187325]|uniref:16S rRNA (cytosine(1402)-N(4))-methyltransferase RsmH n=1 Tax=Actinomyces sp. 187325 TaxID=2927828 RepID=UPI0037BE963A